MFEHRKLVQLKLLCIVLWTAFSTACSGQTLQVDDSTFTVQHLVEGVLATPLVEVSNIQFTGHAEQIGAFNGVQSNIGLDGGVILSTGRVTDAIGPNGTPVSDQGTEFSNPGDSSLAELSGTLSTQDAAILEFDFSTDMDSVYLRYVFASNEYMFYVGTEVNDAFAFFISGPEIIGEQNIAFVPGSTLPVSIDNVNAQLNDHLYIDNENPPGATIEYNGFTVPFTAAVSVTPGQLYHIRFAIADGGDGQFDSAVFLQAHSLTSSSIGLSVSDDHSLQSNFVLYPNPTRARVTLESALDLKHVWLTDIAGRRLMAATPLGAKWQLDLAELPAGLYVVIAVTENGNQVVERVVRTNGN